MSSDSKEVKQMKAELKNDVGHCEKCGRSDSTLCARRLHHSSNPLDKEDYIILCTECNFDLTKVLALEDEDIKVVHEQFTSMMRQVSAITLSRIAEIEGRYLAIAVGKDSFEKRPSYDALIGGAAYLNHRPEIQEMIKVCTSFCKKESPNYQQIASMIRGGILDRDIPDMVRNTKKEQSSPVENTPTTKIPPGLDLNHLADS